jgi:hypothetical protein
MTTYAHGRPSTHERAPGDEPAGDDPRPGPPDLLRALAFALPIALLTWIAIVLAGWWLLRG